MSEGDRRDRLSDLEKLTKNEPVSDYRFLGVPDFVRRSAALLIIIFYGLVLFSSLYIFYRQGNGCSPKDTACAWSDASANALELIKIGIMPVITLVIGYYFGRSDR